VFHINVLYTICKKMNFLWVIRQKERKSFFLLHLLTKQERMYTIKEEDSPE